jgi:hypothetical protein
MAKKGKKPGAPETSARDRCPICNEPIEGGDGGLIECVSCGRSGSDTCCMGGGVGTECVECEESDDDTD